MEIWKALVDILLLLLGALIIGTLFERVRQSAVVGFLVAGMLLGPHGLNLVSSSSEVAMLAELGVSLLLFSIGLEFSSSRLASLRSAGLLGVLQVVATAAVGFLAAIVYGAEVRTAVGIGLIVSLSSTACVLRVLTDRSQLDSGPGRNALGVLLVQDAAVIPLAFTMEFLALAGSDPAAGAATGPSPVALLFGAVGFGLGLWAILHFVAPVLLGSRALSGNRELSLLLAVVTGLGAAAGAHEIGVSPALGAFIAGIVLAGSPFAVQVRSDVGALRAILLTLFFGSVGMLTDPAWIIAHLPSVLGLLAALIIVKAGVVAVIVRAISGSWTHGFASGLALAQIGEFSLLLADLGGGSVVPAGARDHLYSVIILSLLVTPYLVALGGPLERWILRRKRGPEESGPGGHSPGVIVVGFGPAGQRATEEIARSGRPIRVIDLNSASVTRAIELGHEGLVGDAAHPELIEHAGLDNAVLVLVALPDPTTVERVLATVTRMRPGLPIVVRARHHIHRGRFEHYPDVLLVDEEYEVGIRLGELAAGCLAERDEDERDGGGPAADAPIGRPERDPGAVSRENAPQEEGA